MKIKFWSLALAMVTLTSLQAASIKELKFEQLGGDPVAEEQLLFRVQQRPGAEFNPEIAGNDVKRIYESGLANNVSYNVSNDEGEGVVLTYIINLKPMVSSIVFEGNRKFSNRELLGELTIYEDEPLNDMQLRASANKLRAHYSKEGYHQATVLPLIQRNDDGSLTILFKINEHLREKLDKVTFENNTVFNNLDLRYRVATQSWPLLNRFFDLGLLDKSELESDKARLRALYWTKGYLDFAVSDIIITTDPEDPEYVNVNFVLDEGEPYTYTGCEIIGNSIFDTETLMPLVAMGDGQIFNSDLEDATAQRITEFYGTFGYADSSVNIRRNANYLDKTVSLTIDVLEGQKYFIEQVDIIGNKITKEKVIRRELAVMEGDPLDTNRVEVSRQRLLGMGYFNKVDSTLQAGTNSDARRVVYEVEERDPYSLRVGGGFSDSDSLAAMVEFSNNNFDLTNPKDLFRGGGQRFRVMGIIGLESYDFNVDFTEPWLFDIPLRLDVSGFGNEVEYEHWDELRLGVKTSLTKPIFDEFTAISGGYKFEYVSVSGMSSSTSDYLRSLQTHDLVSQFTLLLNRDTRDNLMNPSSGYQVSATGSISPEVAGSTASFYRTELKAGYYYPFLDKAFIWHLGGQIGVVDTMDNQEVPLYERYFLGGGQTLRGFPYREVSPVDENGYNVGGSSMLLLTTEVSHPIWSFIRGAVFCDAGTVGAEAYRFDIDDINVGVGYGLRIIVPQLNAPISLDLAYPIVNNQDSVSSKLRFHFNMGFSWGL